MSLEDDQLAAMKELVDKSMAPPPFVGNVTSADPLQVVVFGSSVPLPAFAVGEELAQGDQVLVLPANGAYYVLGKIGLATPPTPEPEVIDSYLALTTADASYTTTATAIVTTVTVAVGTYKMRANAQWNKDVSNFDHFMKMDFSGTATGNYNFIRYVTNANAGAFGVGYGTETNLGQNDDPQALVADGLLVVSAEGALSMSFRRASGSSSGTVVAGASIQLFRAA